MTELQESAAAALITLMVLPALIWLIYRVTVLHGCSLGHEWALRRQSEIDDIDYIELRKPRCTNEETTKRASQFASPLRAKISRRTNMLGKFMAGSGGCFYTETLVATL